MKTENLNILISGGGTGGHIFPALSIANEIRRRNPNANILFIGASNRMEMEKVPAAGYRIEGLEVSGFDRKNLFKNVSVLIKLFKSMRKARRIIKDFNPDIAIGVGGYVSGPILKEAQKLGIPTLIQEQNSYAGVTNKLLSKKVAAACVAYDGMEKFFPADKIVITGNPVRRGLLDCELTPQEARKKFGLNPDKRTILIVGGSLGARTINQSIAAGLNEIAKSDIQIIWQTGKLYDSTAKSALETIKCGNVLQYPFISDMDVAYRAATLIVSRAGASSISELQLLGKAAILVPSPNVAEDHQTKNAMALVKNDAAVMVTDAESPATLVSTMIELCNNDMKLQSLSTNIEKMALKNADEKIVDKVMEVIINNKK